MVSLDWKQSAIDLTFKTWFVLVKFWKTTKGKLKFLSKLARWPILFSNVIFSCMSILTFPKTKFNFSTFSFFILQKYAEISQIWFYLEWLIFLIKKIFINKILSFFFLIYLLMYFKCYEKFTYVCCIFLWINWINW